MDTFLHQSLDYYAVHTFLSYFFYIYFYFKRCCFASIPFGCLLFDAFGNEIKSFGSLYDLFYIYPFTVMYSHCQLCYHWAYIQVTVNGLKAVILMRACCATPVDKLLSLHYRLTSKSLSYPKSQWGLASQVLLL